MEQDRQDATSSFPAASDRSAGGIIERALRRPMIRLGHFFFRFRNIVSPVILITLGAITLPKLLCGDEFLDHLMDAGGIALVLAGQTLRAAVIGFAYIKRGGKNKKIYADTLVQEGIFAHCRHPLYVGNILILMGLLVIHNSPWFYLVGVPFFLLLYLSLVLAEEDFLRRKFGRLYEDYCRRTPRFIPAFRGLGTTLKGMQFNWKKLIRKEYGTAFAWTSIVLVLIIWEDLVNLGFKEEVLEVTILACLWILVAAASVAARILKKRGALGRG